MIKVFVAGPYTKGDVDDNLDKQKDVVNELINLGFNPLPLNLCYHLVQSKFPRDRYADWIDITLDWVHECHCLLRMPGESRGADEEVERANEQGVPVFYSIEELIKYYEL